jgi:CP family cyanate transporter-like MFS transporter
MQRASLTLTIPLLWIMGAVIRLPILAIAPLIPFIQTNLKMSGTEVGILSGIPMIVLAVAALPGSVAVALRGAFGALVLGVFVTMIGSALRGFATTSLLLFAATALMSVGIAVAQPALPVLVRQWMPDRMGLGTATYSNGMIAGCIIPVALTLPFVMPALNGSWQHTIVAWSLPVGFGVALMIGCSSRLKMSAPADKPSPLSFRNFDYSLIWRIGLMFGANNCVYFGTNSFLPPYLIATGRAELITQALTAYNTTQLFGSLAVVLLSKFVERRRWPYIGAGICIVINLAWLATTSGIATVVAAGILGFFSGTTLATGLMLPPLLSKPSEIARTAGAMFTISYSFAMIGMVAGGAVWDIAGHPRFAFAILALCALPLILVTPTLKFART